MVQQASRPRAAARPAAHVCGSAARVDHRTKRAGTSPCDGAGWLPPHAVRPAYNKFVAVGKARHTHTRAHTNGHTQAHNVSTSAFPKNIAWRLPPSLRRWARWAHAAAVCGAQDLRTHRISHLPFFPPFFSCGGQSTTRIASSNTFLSPFCVSGSTRGTSSRRCAAACRGPPRR